MPQRIELEAKERRKTRTQDAKDEAGRLAAENDNDKTIEEYSKALYNKLKLMNK